MAELSLETQEIINRLKAEGELIRNTGTNSIKNSNVKLEKMVGLMSSIQANIAHQTTFMKEGLGIQRDMLKGAGEALEKSNTQEQLDELAPPTVEEKNKETATRKDFDPAIDKFGDKVAKALSMKNLAIAGLVGFAGYNLFKGYFDEANDGAWTKLENEVALLGPKLAELGKIDFKAKFDEAEKDFDQFKSDLGDLNKTLKELNVKLKTILDFSWGDILTGISLFSVSMAVLTNRIKSMGMDLRDGTRTKNGQTWVQQALGIGKKVDDGAGRGPTGGALGVDTPEARAETAKARAAAIEAAKMGKPVVKPITPVVGGGEISKPQLRLDAANSTSSKATGLQMRGNRLVNATGQYVSDADALKIMESTLDGKYSKVLKNLIKLFKAVGIVFAIASIWEIYNVLSSDLSDDEKMVALGPVVGGIVGGVGGAAIGAAIGVWGGPWGVFILATVGGVGGALAGDTLGYYVAKWAFTAKPTEEERAQMTVRPRPAGGHALRNWNKAFRNTHNADGTPMTQMRPVGSGRGAVNEVPGERRNYVLKREAQVLDTLLDAEIQYQEQKQETQDNIKALEDYLGISYAPGALGARLNTVTGGAGGGASFNMINAPVTNVTPVTTNVGGSDVKQVTFNGGSGTGGNGTSPFDYGLTAAWA